MNKNIVPVLVIFSVSILFLPGLQSTSARSAGDDGPYITPIGVEMWSENHTMFTTYFKVHAGESAIENVIIIISSDRESVETVVEHISADTYELLTLDISAYTPHSIHAKVIDYNIRGQ
jgi:hypothetical protein